MFPQADDPAIREDLLGRCSVGNSMVLYPVFNPRFLPPDGGVNLPLFHLETQQIPITHPHGEGIGDRGEQIRLRRIKGNDAVVGIKQNKAVRDGIQRIPKCRYFGAQLRLGFFQDFIGVGRELHRIIRIHEKLTYKFRCRQNQYVESRTANANASFHIR
jgi:hypothetical protein